MGDLKMVKSNKDLLKDITALFEGSGTPDLSLIANQVRQFCPFEAMGMVRQEIRHSNFLSYILDPARPHGLDDLILRAFLQKLCNRPNDRAAWYDVLEDEKETLTAQVYRERDNIDILIVVPQTGRKGLVVAVELKIDAEERYNQLADYEGKVRRRYPDRDWDHMFCFLTPKGREPTTFGGASWHAVSFAELFKAMDCAPIGSTGEGVKLLGYYQAMMRRHGMADETDNEDLRKATETVWAEHREVLEYLIDHRPDPLNDLMKEFAKEQSKIAERISTAIGKEVFADSHFRNRWYRFTFPEFGKRIPLLLQGDEGWIDSRSQLVFEVTFDPQKNAIMASFCVGYFNTEKEFRPKLIEALNVVSGHKHKIDKPTVKHYWKNSILTENDLSGLEDGIKIFERKLIDYANEYLPLVEVALAKTSHSFLGSV